MASPHTFLRWFREELHRAGIRFAITSGQACVYYGIQQTTKDSDWIVEPADLASLQSLLAEMDESDDTAVSYRGVCGAPLGVDFLGNGWTSHLSLTDAQSTEHHLDFFGKAPRVHCVEHDALDSDYAARVTVAQMKKTDREKDWPFVLALGRQAVSHGDSRGVLHGHDADWLVEAWKGVSDTDRVPFEQQRPLLRLIDVKPRQLRRALMVERHIWIVVNRERYAPFQRTWKEFYRQWRSEKDFEWPGTSTYPEQHQRLTDAARRYKLPQAPLDDAARERALETARNDAADVLAATDAELDEVTPPLDVLLP